MKHLIAVSREKETLFTAQTDTLAVRDVMDLLSYFEKRFPKSKGFKIVTEVDYRQIENYESPGEYIKKMEKKLFYLGVSE